MLDWTERVIVIGEVAQAHDGSLGIAHAHIDAIADAGADAVKFQTHIASAESTPDEPWRVRFSHEDATRLDYWRRMEFTEEQWAGLREHAEQRTLAFLSSPFSPEAVELLERVGVAAWKVASGETANPLLLDRIAVSRLPILLSTGMSPWSEIDAAVTRVRERTGAPLAVLQCTSAYPTAPEELGLNLVGELRERYGCAAGLSDHSGTIFPSLAATALGARVIEVHVALSRHMFGPDTPASVTVKELRDLVRGVRLLDRALASPVDKDAMAERLQGTRALFTRSVVARRDLSPGTVLAGDDLAAKKPGGGLPPQRLGDLVGRRLRIAVAADEWLAEEHLEPTA
ncbi:MAG: N-acetylneuraminate synthase family protein [Solirubrobacteraceae bacterium]